MKKFLILLVALSTFVVSCKKDFGDLNTNTKLPTSVPPGTLFSYAQKSVVDIMTSTNVNNNIFRLFVQNWTETTYTDEAKYDLATRNIPQNFWNMMYSGGFISSISSSQVGVLVNLKDAARLVPLQNVATVPADIQVNQAACVELMQVYAYAILVNTFGNIPYSEALNSDNVHPKYDDAQTIYNDLLQRIDAAVATIDPAGEGFGENDLYFGGDMSRWVTFANSMKLRLGMIIADVDEPRAKTAVSAALGSAVSNSNDNIIFYYQTTPPNTNPVWVDLVQSGRKDFVAANTLVDSMKSRTDPRIPYYFTVDKDGVYTGGVYGASNNYARYSKPSLIVRAADNPAVLFDDVETNFLHAEAIARGFVSGDTAAYYSAAIRASILAWGGTSADADAYLAQSSVDYAKAPGTWKEKIGTQAWIAYYNRGEEAWTTWRRLDFPKLVAPVGAKSDVPLRLTYPVQEQNLNTANYNAVVGAIGADVVGTKIFWDIH